MVAVVLFVGCLVAFSAALNLGQFVNFTAALAWAAAAAVDGVWAVFVVVWAAVAVVWAGAGVDGV